MASASKTATAGRVGALGALGALALALAAPAVALAQEPTGNAPPTEADGLTKRFACQDGGSLLTRFATEKGRLVVIVDTLDGEGPHTLISQPYAGPPVQLLWTDGHRTLTWSPGVQIMWMDAAVHRMCGGGHHH